MRGERGKTAARGRLVAVAAAALAALLLLALYAFASGYRTGSDMAARDARQAG